MSVGVCEHTGTRDCEQWTSSRPAGLLTGYLCCSVNMDAGSPGWIADICLSLASVVPRPRGPVSKVHVGAVSYLVFLRRQPGSSDICCRSWARPKQEAATSPCHRNVLPRVSRAHFLPVQINISGGIYPCSGWFSGRWQNPSGRTQRSNLSTAHHQPTADKHVQSLPGTHQPSMWWVPIPVLSQDMSILIIYTEAPSSITPPQSLSRPCGLLVSTSGCRTRTTLASCPSTIGHVTVYVLARRDSSGLMVLSWWTTPLGNRALLCGSHSQR